MMNALTVNAQSLLFQGLAVGNGGGSADGGAFFDMVNSATEDTATFGGQFLLGLGVILVIFAAFMLFLGITKKQQRGVKFATSAAAFLVGGFLLTQGFTRSENIANQFGKTAEGWSKGEEAGSKYSSKR